MGKNDVEWEEFKLKRSRGKKLKIDSLDNPENAIKKVTDELIESIHKAESQAIKNNIKTNAILLSSEFNLTKSFYYAIGFQVKEVPPMVLGKAAYLDTDKILPNDIAFAIFESPQIHPLEELEKLKNLFKKYVKTDGKSLRFKNISYKRNKEDFERILEIICKDL